MLQLKDGDAKHPQFTGKMFKIIEADTALNTLRPRSILTTGKAMQSVVKNHNFSSQVQPQRKQNNNSIIDG